MKENIMLIGFMGTGKSTVSHGLSAKTGMQEIDLDDYIVRKTGCSINQIFEEKGENGFRDIETACLKEVLQQTGNIISCGGGTVIRSENVSCMKEHGRIVLLKAQPQTVYERVKDNNDRPILNGNMTVSYIAELMEQRRELYETAKDFAVETDGRSIDDICQEILQNCEN